jgi:hypothetical protein
MPEDLAAYGIVRVVITIKEATSRAIDFAREVLGPERTASVRLEEVESATVDGADAWLVTLSMAMRDDEKEQLSGGIASIFGKSTREYKTITVLKRDGEVKSMKIRALAGV